MDKTLDVSNFSGNLDIDDSKNKVDFQSHKGDSYYSQLATPPEGKDTCPECNEEIVRNGRCRTCYICGWSSCDL